MAFPGRPAHDFLLFIPVRRRAAFLHGPTPLPRAWGLPFLSGPLSAVGRAGAWWMRGPVLSGRGGL